MKKLHFEKNHRKDLPSGLQIIPWYNFKFKYTVAG